MDYGMYINEEPEGLILRQALRSLIYVDNFLDDDAWQIRVLYQSQSVWSEPNEWNTIDFTITNAAQDGETGFGNATAPNPMVNLMKNDISVVESVFFK